MCPLKDEITETNIILYYINPFSTLVTFMHYIPYFESNELKKN